MSPELRAVAIFAAASAIAWLLTPLAMRAAVRLQLLDIPTGYKVHLSSTPYLGGAAILGGIIFAGVLLAGPRPGLFLNHGWAVVACALVLLVLGTADDRINLPVGLRVAIEAGLAVALFYLGHGWQIFHLGALNLGLTIVWVVGVVNAFNLMDNMDGAAATAAGVSAVGAGTLALLSGKAQWAPLCFATAGACTGFLPYNLSRPARIFMGDGGSLPVGMMVAALTMSVVRSDYFGPSGVVVGALLVGLVILDTTLVAYSRRRGRRPVFSGGRDHLTHRVIGRLGSTHAVAATLAVTQFVIAAIAIAVARAGVGWVLLAGSLCIVFGAVLIWRLERMWLAATGDNAEREPIATARANAARTMEPVGTAQAEPQPEQAIA